MKWKDSILYQGVMEEWCVIRENWHGLYMSLRRLWQLTKPWRCASCKRWQWPSHLKITWLGMTTCSSSCAKAAGQSAQGKGWL